MQSFTTLSIASALFAVTMTGAIAQTLTATGSTYVTKTAEGTNSTKSLAVESNTAPGDAGFGEFGIYDFSGTSALTSGTKIGSFTLNLTSFSSKYGISGPLDFFLASGTKPLTYAEGYLSTDVGTSTSAVQTDGPNDGIDPKLGTLTSLGQQMYVAQPYTAGMASVNGPATYTFALSAAAQSVLEGDLAAGDVQLVIGAPTGSATSTEFDGAGYVPKTGTYTTPTLMLTPASAPAVPEASTTVSFGLLLAFGLGGLVLSRRRKVA